MTPVYKFSTSKLSNKIAYGSMAATTPSSGGGGGGVTTSTRAAFGGGNTSHTTQNTIDYVEIPTTGNATDFGDLTAAKNNNRSGPSSGTRGIFGSNETSTKIEYITLASLGNATSFGGYHTDMGSRSGYSDSTRGIFAGGETSGGDVRYNNIEYITIATTGNGTDFGDLTQARYESQGCANTTRGVSAGGNYNATGGGAVNTIDYVTIQTTGNATDFGDLVSARDGTAAAGGGGRGIFACGILTSTNITNTIDYITISTTGNATNFGSFSSNRRYCSGVAGETRAIFTGGLTTQGGTYTINGTMEYVTIASTGSSTTFGDLSQARWLCGTVSGSHGGLV
jgi:hypothetical protein